MGWLRPNHYVTQARTGHGDFQARLASLGLAESDDCKWRDGYRRPLSPRMSGIPTTESRSVESHRRARMARGVAPIGGDRRGLSGLCRLLQGIPLAKGSRQQRYGGHGGYLEGISPRESVAKGGRRAPKNKLRERFHKHALPPSRVLSETWRKRTIPKVIGDP